MGNLEGRLKQVQVTAANLTTSVTLQQFRESVNDLQLRISDFSDSDGKRLLLEVESENTGILWKMTVRVRCTKVDGRTGREESSRLLNLREFLHMKEYVCSQLQTPAASDDHPLCVSLILDRAQASAREELRLPSSLETVGEEAEEDFCIICMERPANLVHACGHRHCETCTEAWNRTSTTCPVCRRQTADSKDSWVVAEKPDSSLVAEELNASVMTVAGTKGQLADRS